MQQAQASVAVSRGDVARGVVGFQFMIIKMFTEFGLAAEKPLDPSGVEELTGVWNRVQQLVAAQELSVASARRCVRAAAIEAARLSGSSATISQTDVREAMRIVRSRSTATAGTLCA